MKKVTKKTCKHKKLLFDKKFPFYPKCVECGEVVFRIKSNMPRQL